jgi:hypothetical protein
LGRFTTEVGKFRFAHNDRSLCLGLRSESGCTLRVKFIEIGVKRLKFFNGFGPISNQFTGLRRPLAC